MSNPNRKMNEVRRLQYATKLVGCSVNILEIKAGNNKERNVSFEELLMSQVVQHEAITRLLVEKGILTKENYWGAM